MVALPWQLPSPLSRMVAVPDRGSILVAGGLDPAGSSTTAVHRIDPRTGASRRVGRLAAPVHDAAGAVLGALVVFGGGSTSSIDAVQRVGTSGRSVVIGHLPEPRSDLSAVTVAGTAYLLGGYTGVDPLPAVLATRDGVRMRTVAHLPTPVRYAAAVAAGHDVFVYGGEWGGEPVDTIQRIDLTTGRATVVGHLRRAVSDASAFLLDGRVVLAGGRRTNGLVSDRVLVFGAGGTHVIGHARLPTAVADAAAVVIDGHGYLVGGETASGTSARPVAAVQRLDVASR